MSNYTQEELKGMTRVQLRRAAIEVLKISNREASDYNSKDLIAQIIDAQGENGNGTEKRAERSTKGKAASKTRASKTKASKKEDTAEAAPSTNGVGKLVDAVGKAVDETKEELGTKLDELSENIEHIMKQQFLLFGVFTDVYKATAGGKEELEERLEELGEDWDNQGNEE